MRYGVRWDNKSEQATVANGYKSHVNHTAYLNGIGVTMK